MLALDPVLLVVAPVLVVHVFWMAFRLGYAIGLERVSRP
jgi:hypothetical protein